MTTRGSLARGQGQQQYQGNVQKWIRQWVEPGKTPGSSKVALLKWVATGDRSGSKPGPRFPHLQPVSDPNIKTPSGQKDKGKMPIARQPEHPVQPVPMDIDSGQAAAADRPVTIAAAGTDAPDTARASLGTEKTNEATTPSAANTAAAPSDPGQAAPAISLQPGGPSSDPELGTEANLTGVAAEAKQASDSIAPNDVHSDPKAVAATAAQPEIATAQPGLQTVAAMASDPARATEPDMSTAQPTAAMDEADALDTTEADTAPEPEMPAAQPAVVTEEPDAAVTTNAAEATEPDAAAQSGETTAQPASLTAGGTASEITQADASAERSIGSSAEAADRTVAKASAAGEEQSREAASAAEPDEVTAAALKSVAALNMIPQTSACMQWPAEPAPASVAEAHPARQQKQAAVETQGQDEQPSAKRPAEGEESGLVPPLKRPKDGMANEEPLD